MFCVLSVESSYDVYSFCCVFGFAVTDKENLGIGFFVIEFKLCYVFAQADGTKLFCLLHKLIVTVITIINNAGKNYNGIFVITADAVCKGNRFVVEL